MYDRWSCILQHEDHLTSPHLTHFLQRLQPHTPVRCCSLAKHDRAITPFSCCCSPLMNTVDVPWKLLKREEIFNSPSRNWTSAAARSSTSTTSTAAPVATVTTAVNHLPVPHIPPLLTAAPLSLEDEKRLRSHWAAYIQQVGALLDLPNVTVCSACVYWHRFYSHCPLQDYDPLISAQAALLLASKVEENTRRVRDVINVAHTAANQSAPPLAISQLYWDVKEHILRQEQAMLRALSFSVSYTHPHFYLLHICRHLECSASLTSLAYYVLNDSQRTTLSLQYAPPSLACAAVYLASEMVSETVTGKTAAGGGGGGGESGGGGGGEREWWEEFSANRMEVEDICHQLLDLYDMLAAEHDGSSGGSHALHTGNVTPYHGSGRRER